MISELIANSNIGHTCIHKYEYGRKGKNADASAVVDAASVTDFGCKGKGRLKSYSEFRNLSEKLFKDLKGQTDEKLDFDG